MGVNEILNVTLGKILNIGEPWGLIIISFILTALITLIYKLMTDQKLMKSLKAEIKDLQKEMKEFKENPEKVMAMQKQAMEKNMKYMMHSMKPMLITFIPLILIYGWLRSYYPPGYTISLGFVSLGWFWVYIIFSIIFSIGLRKLLKLH